MTAELERITSLEISRVRAFPDFVGLSNFSRNLTTWELLLVLYRGDCLTIGDAIGKLQTRHLGYSSVVKFIQDNVTSGQLVAKDGIKKSAKHLVLAPEARRELEIFLEAHGVH